MPSATANASSVTSTTARAASASISSPTNYGTGSIQTRHEPVGRSRRRPLRKYRRIQEPPQMAEPSPRRHSEDEHQAQDPPAGACAAAHERADRDHLQRALPGPLGHRRPRGAGQHRRPRGAGQHRRDCGSGRHRREGRPRCRRSADGDPGADRARRRSLQRARGRRHWRPAGTVQVRLGRRRRPEQHLHLGRAVPGAGHRGHQLDDHHPGRDRPPAKRCTTTTARRASTGPSPG